jgi:O-antigen/teichoic acid export membrane protein
LDVLVAASLLTPLVASAANNFQLRRSLHPRQSSNVVRNQEVSRAIRKDGALFFCLQLAAALAFSADLPLISAIQGPEIAGKYAIVQRMFAVIPMALALVWAPLWPIYRQALSVSDRDWVQRTLSWSTAAAVSIAALAGLTLVLGFNQLSALWLGQTFSPSLLLLWGFAAWSIFDALGTSLATLLNAAGVLRFQVAIACAFAVTCVAGKVIVIFLSGVELMPWITLVSWLTCALLPLLLFRRQLISQVFSNSQMETS